MRADLAALSPEAITALANAGLVKRAQREIAEGKGPSLEESADGVVVGACPDGATVRWPPSTSLRDATCTCGAPGACRHRVAVALAYRDWERASRQPSSAEAPPPSSRRFEAWSPGDIDDAALSEHLGPRTVEAARIVRSRGIIVRVRAATPKDPIPSAALPSCTVRFLAPRAIALSRCDCQVADACAHIALAVWAFRLADGAGATAPSDEDPVAERTIELTGGKSGSVDLDAMEPLRALARWVLGAGVSTVAASDAFEQRAALARAPLEGRGYVWMLGLLDELTEAIGAYRRRAAGYRARAALEIVAEIEARVRSASAPPHELPASFVVGRDTPLETKLDHLRLTSLGARVTVEDDATTVRILLANPETGDVLALDKTFPAESSSSSSSSSSKPEPLDARGVAARRLGGSTIGAIATGHVVTRAAVRRANDALRLGSTTRGTTSVTPQTGDLSILPSPRRAESADALRAHLRGRAPALLRPRRLGEDVFVLGVTGVEGAAFDPAEQAVFATIVTASGSALLVRHHHRGSPRALDAVASALSGKFGALTWVAGEVDVEHDVLRIVPTMLCADRVIVPDFEEDPPRLALAPGRAPAPPAGGATARAELLERLTEVAHTGVAALPPTFPERLRRASEAARRQGLKALAARGDALAAAIQGKPADVFDRWSDAAIRAQL